MKLSFLLIINLLSVVVFSQTDCQFTTTIKAPNCNNENGRIDITMLRGMPPYTFEWSENANTKNSSTAYNLSSGVYSITISDAAACVQIDTFSLIEASDFSITGQVLASECNARTGRLQIDILDGDSTSTYFYSINNLTYQFSNVFENLQPGSYTLYAKIDNACIDSTTLVIPFPDPLAVELGEDYIVSLGDSVMLDAYNYDNRFSSFAWSPVEGLSCADCPQPTVTITDTKTFTLTVTDSMGCTASDNVQIFVQKDRNIFIPNAFSPNTDGINDDFTIFSGEGVVELRDFVIYGRWGNLVHEINGTFPANDYRFSWDGKFKGRRVASGEYVYQFVAIFQDGAEELYQGIVKLVR